MEKVDLLQIDPIPNDGKVTVRFTFSNVDRYVPTQVTKVAIPIEEYLHLLNHVLEEEGKPGGWEYKGDTISVNTTKTTSKIVYKDYYFTLKYKDIFVLVKQEIEKLYTYGIIG